MHPPVAQHPASLVQQGSVWFQQVGLARPWKLGRWQQCVGSVHPAVKGQAGGAHLLGARPHLLVGPLLETRVWVWVLVQGLLALLRWAVEHWRCLPVGCWSMSLHGARSCMVVRHVR